MADFFAGLPPPLQWIFLIAIGLFGILANVVLVVAFIRFLPYAIQVAINSRRFPSVGELSVKVWGQEFAYRAMVDRARDEQIDALEQRIANIEDASERQGRAIESIIEDLLEGDSENVW